jgi:uncharacterized membrane protein
MKNRNVGLLIIGLALVIGVIIFLFNSALTNIVNTTCSHGPSCTMYSTIKTQTYIGVSLLAIILIIGLVLVFTKENTQIVEKTITKTIKEKKKPLDLSGLDGKEKALLKIIQEHNGVIFQAELMEKANLGKVGLTRLLDKLEAKQIVERKRRGMNNIVILRN